MMNGDMMNITQNAISLDSTTLDVFMEIDGPNGREYIRPVATVIVDNNTRTIASLHLGVPKPNDEQPILTDNAVS